MVSFWETVRGTRLADVLTRELPKLTAKKEQHIVQVLDHEDLADLEKSLEKGARVVTSFVLEGTTYVIVEVEEH